MEMNQKRSSHTQPNMSQKRTSAPTQRTQMSRDEARRAQAALRRKKKRRQQRIFYGVLLFLIVLVGVILSLTVFFHIEKVTVEGESIYADEEIIAASKIEIDDNLFMIGSDKVSNRIEKSLPYINSVQITRKLPSTVVINITPTERAYAFSTEAGYTIVDKNGKVLETQIPELSEGAVIYGAELKNAVVGETAELADENDFLLINNLAQTLADEEINGITEIDITNELDITMLYKDKVRIEFGSTAKLEKKVKMAAKALEDHDMNNPSQTGVLDLKNKYVVFNPQNIVEEESVTDIQETTVAAE